MAQGHHFIVLSIISIILLIVLSKCNSYPLFHELPAPERPTKFYSQNDVDRYVNRMKQHYATMAQLRLWRRDIDQSNEEYDEILQDTPWQYANFDDKR